MNYSSYQSADGGETPNDNNDTSLLSALRIDEKIRRIDFATYYVIMPTLVAVGVCGNILNLVTLRSRALQSVPFMYIRAITWFDLIALVFVGFFSLKSTVAAKPTDAWRLYYFAHLQLPIINSLLTASLFVAFMLTVERYRSASVVQFYQLRVIRFDQKLKARLYITASLVLSVAMYLPMIAFENIINCEPRTDYTNCTIGKYETSWKRLISGYQWTREAACRIVPVTLLAVLNAVLVRKLRQIKRRRNQLILKQMNLNQLDKCRSASGGLMSTIDSFAEKRLTTMMVAIAFIYLLGNIPQSVLMVLTGRERDVAYEIFRSTANVTEIANHCLNFYVFCLTSRDYLITFVRRCRRLKRAVFGKPSASARKASADSQQSSPGARMTFEERSLLGLSNNFNEDLIPL